MKSQVASWTSLVNDLQQTNTATRAELPCNTQGRRNKVSRILSLQYFKSGHGETSVSHTAYDGVHSLYALHTARTVQRAEHQLSDSVGGGEAQP